MSETAPNPQPSSTADSGTPSRVVAKDIRKKKVSLRRKNQSTGLKFPVAKFRRMLRNGKYAKRLSSNAPIYVTATLEYLAIEMIDSCIDIMRDSKKLRLIPRHILLTKEKDEDFQVLMKNTCIKQGGVLPAVLTVLTQGIGGKKKGGGKTGPADSAATQAATPAPESAVV